MTRLLLVLFCAVITACSTPESRPIDTKKYIFLWEKNFGDRCIAAFHSESLLYFFVSSSKWREDYPNVVVYDPRTSFLASFSTSNKDIKECRNVNLVYLRPMHYVADLYFIDSPEFRAIIDSFTKNPEALKNAISEPPPLFKRWNEGGVAINIDFQNISNAKSIDDVSLYLKHLSAERAMDMITKRKSFLAKKKAEWEERKLRTKQAQDRWTNRMSKKLSVGDKVCTWNNMFGFVEDIKGEMVKVHVVGRADSFLMGFFFSGFEGSHEYARVDAPRWFERGDLAHCQWKD